MGCRRAKEKRQDRLPDPDSMHDDQLREPNVIP